MLLSSLRYKINTTNIATEPRDVRLGRRDFGKMLVVDRTTSKLFDSHVQELDEWIKPGDVLVLNDSMRSPGVLKGRVDGTAMVDIVLVSLIGQDCCLASISPMFFIKVGVSVVLTDGNILSVAELDVGPHKLTRLVSRRPLIESLNKVGFPITSFFYSDFWSIEHYNPVYASKLGSVESPMAGLHFSFELLNKLASQGVVITFITLHVVGSWLPPLGKDTSTYAVYPEPFVVSSKTVASITSAKKAGRKVFAVGSTVMRALETAALSGSLEEADSTSEIFISPGHKFRVADGYFTNFHQAKSGLMALDAAFCNKKLLLEAYNYAAQKNYMFFEFGDAVLYV